MRINFDPDPKLGEDLDVLGFPFRIRPLRFGDRGYVAATWGNSYRDQSRMPRAEYRDRHPRILDQCLDHGTTLVLCKRDLEYVLVGYACGSPGVLHYAYLAQHVRGHGAGRRLMAMVTGTSPEEPCACSHRFKPREQASRFTFDPLYLEIP